jgi:hypothetical protein
LRSTVSGNGRGCAAGRGWPSSSRASLVWGPQVTLGTPQVRGGAGPEKRGWFEWVLIPRAMSWAWPEYEFRVLRTHVEAGLPNPPPLRTQEISGEIRTSTGTAGDTIWRNVWTFIYIDMSTHSYTWARTHKHPCTRPACTYTAHKRIHLHTYVNTYIHPQFICVSTRKGQARVCVERRD